MHRVEKRELIIAWRSQKDLPREETWGGPKCLLPSQCHLLKGLQPRHLAHQTTGDLSSNKPKFWWQLDTPVSIQHGSVALPSSNTGFHPFCLFFLLCCHLKSFLLPTHSNTLFFFTVQLKTYFLHEASVYTQIPPSLWFSSLLHCLKCVQMTKSTWSLYRD